MLRANIPEDRLNFIFLTFEENADSSDNEGGGGWDTHSGVRSIPAGSAEPP